MSVTPVATAKKVQEIARVFGHSPTTKPDTEVSAALTIIAAELTNIRMILTNMAVTMKGNEE